MKANRGACIHETRHRHHQTFKLDDVRDALTASASAA
jgi:hypothetical protein